MDVLRYWVGAHASQSPAIQISDNVMESSKQEVDKIRNSLRFIISNLHVDNLELLDLKVGILIFFRNEKMVKKQARKDFWPLSAM